MIKDRDSFKCNLIAKNGEMLLKFNAHSVDTLTENASFVGGNIASAGQELTIWTEKAYKYLAYEHSVEIDGTIYKITEVGKAMKKKVGASCMSRIDTVYILYLA